MQEQAIKESTYLVARKQDKPSATYYLGADQGPQPQPQPPVTYRCSL